MLVYGQILNVVQFQSPAFLNLLWLSGLQMLWITVSLFPSLIQHWSCKSCLGKLTLEPIETGLYQFHYGKMPLVIRGGIETSFFVSTSVRIKNCSGKEDLICFISVPFCSNKTLAWWYIGNISSSATQKIISFFLSRWFWFCCGILAD